MTELFSNIIYRDAMADIESLGVHVSPVKSSTSKCYTIVGGRSNARWWLVPLSNGRVTASGFALFQPLLTSARILKLVVCALSLLGLSWLWSRNKIYLSGESKLGTYFPNLAEPIYAYFTGTDSPHRKVAVQVMDSKGHIKGFAKLGCSPEVVSLLQNETAMLEKVKALQLKTVHIPQVLYSGPMGEGYCLLTDTLKTPLTGSATEFGQAQRAFLRELAAVTAQSPSTAATVAAKLESRIEHRERQFDPGWRMRLQKAVDILAEQDQLPIPQCMSHGDFTPWNTFMVSGCLYVFDWEYAEQTASPGNDIIHFVLNQPRLRRSTAAGKVASVSVVLAEPWVGLGQQLAQWMLIIYLLTQVLRQIERLPESECRHSSWDGAEGQAAMLDELLQSESGARV